MLCVGKSPRAHDSDSRHKEAVISADSIQLVDINPHNLEVGSVVHYGEPPQCGVIKWIGHFPNEEGIYAGLEMVWPRDD